MTAMDGGDSPGPDILLIGCGNMGAALATGYLQAVPGASVVAVARDVGRVRSRLPLDTRVVVVGSMEEVGGREPAMTVLAVKPQVLAAMLPLLAARPLARSLIVSIAAGTSIATLRQHLPEARLVRAMPNTPAMVGAGFTALWGDPTVSPEDRQRCNSLFGAVGTAHWLRSEDEIAAVTAISGSGPAYFFAIIEALVEAGMSLGLSMDLADRMARATMAGAASMLHDPSAVPAALKTAVRSPNGTTDAALRVFEEGHVLEQLVGHAVRAAYEKAIALGSLPS